MCTPGYTSQRQRGHIPSHLLEDCDMRVLIVTEDYPPGLRTGIGRHVEDLANSLNRLAPEVWVVAPGLIVGPTGGRFHETPSSARFRGVNLQIPGPFDLA